jgi:3-dehydroquinate dehydratase-2
MKILIINGPNLNLLGKREPLLYGKESFSSYMETLSEAFPEMQLKHIQTNSEVEMVDAIQGAGGDGVDGVVLNPAAFSHTSLAVADAVAAVDVPVVEVHISNIFARDSARHHSLVSRYAAGVVVGFGLEGYRLAVAHFQRF